MQCSNSKFYLYGNGYRNQQWSKALHYFIPMGAYLLGTVLSEALPKPIKKMEIIRWDTLLIGIEMIVIFVLGLVPEAAPFQISQISINVIMSMQFNTFRQARGIPMATTFVRIMCARLVFIYIRPYLIIVIKII